jgi:hypothetical protein
VYKSDNILGRRNQEMRFFKYFWQTNSLFIDEVYDYLSIYKLLFNHSSNICIPNFHYYFPCVIHSVIFKAIFSYTENYGKEAEKWESLFLPQQGLTEVQIDGEQ